MNNETKLILRYRDGDESAINLLISSNEGLINFLFNKYFNLFSHYKEDFLQEGRIGLIEAFKRFDQTKEKQFNYYKSLWIRKKMGLFKAKVKPITSFSDLAGDVSFLGLPQEKVNSISEIYSDLSFFLDYPSVSSRVTPSEHENLCFSLFSGKKVNPETSKKLKKYE